ncbi:P-loop containing nucleoside triphosphate hydrolase protein, partial [Scenedesmus sp. NREL 46B-D3]
KVEAIVRRLLLLLQLDPAHKVIVFSSWLDVLDILSHALTINGVLHAFGRGRKGFLQALEHPAAAAGAAGAGGACHARPRVLLMLVAHGAAGLNLTEAQHVVLAEPLLDPAQELQATGRVSRFGQTATTHVHRFVVQHTVEENVARLSRQRATAMDMSAAVPAKRPGAGSSEAADLTVADVAALLSSKWSEGGGGDAGWPAGADGGVAGEGPVELQV